MPKRSKTAANAKEFEAFGRRLVDLLEANGRPRHGAGRYLADRYKVSTVTANAWLNGEHRAEATVARTIAEDHGVSFDSLYFGRQAKAQLIEPMLSPEENELIAQYRAVDDDGRQMISRLAEALVLQLSVKGDGQGAEKPQ